MMLTMKHNIALFLLTGLLFPTVNASTELVFYTDRTAWESEVNSDISTENFNSVASFNLVAGINNTGLISIELIDHSQVSDKNSIEDEWILGMTIDNSPFFRGSFIRSDINAITNLILPAPVYAFGGDFTTTHNVDGLALRVNGIEYLFEDLLPSGDGDGFLGFISTIPFSVVTLYDPVQDNAPVYRLGESFGLDNVSFPIPEPATLGLLGLGVLCLGKFRKYNS